MKIGNELILKLEKLSKLELSDAERKQFTTDLGHIMDMVEKLRGLDTTGVAPLVYVNEDVNRLRDDVVQGEVSREAALRNAPEQDGAHFKVPRML
jgi:aspartyl-tRNA(Asn)/glutamyl-tRNA(Gln) amidotransferase subunit C